LTDNHNDGHRQHCNLQQELGASQRVLLEGIATMLDGEFSATMLHNRRPIRRRLESNELPAIG
jgi:hypothetical protein